MSLRPIVKVSHLSNLSDARFCSGMGVELLGFGAIPGSEHYMPPPVFQEIRGWLAGPAIIAEVYGVASPEQILEVMQTYAPDHLELTWEEYQAFREHLTVPCLVYCSDLKNVRSVPQEENIAYLLSGEETTCEDITDLSYPVLVRVRSLEHLQSKIKAGCYAGYVLEGPPQIRAGVTNYDELGDILEALGDE